ncbi:hypothetical protein LguiA_023533 [Lonicera macranthoides]
MQYNFQNGKLQPILQTQNQKYIEIKTPYPKSKVLCFSMHPLHFFLFDFAFLFGSTLTLFVHSREEFSKWSYEPDSESQVTAEFLPRLVTAL